MRLMGNSANVFPKLFSNENGQHERMTNLKTGLTTSRFNQRLRLSKETDLEQARSLTENSRHKKSVLPTHKRIIKWFRAWAKRRWKKRKPFQLVERIKCATFKRTVRSAYCSVGVPSCPSPARRSAVRPNRMQPLLVWVFGFDKCCQPTKKYLLTTMVLIPRMSGNLSRHT